MKYVILEDTNEYTEIGFNDESKTRITIGKSANSAVFVTQDKNGKYDVVKFPIEYLSLLNNLDKTIEEYNNNELKKTNLENFKRVIKEYNKDIYNKIIANDKINELYDDFYERFKKTGLDADYDGMKFFFEDIYKLDESDYLIELSKTITEPQKIENNNQSITEKVDLLYSGKLKITQELMDEFKKSNLFTKNELENIILGLPIGTGCKVEKPKTIIKKKGVTP